MQKSHLLLFAYSDFASATKDSMKTFLELLVPSEIVQNAP